MSNRVRQCPVCDRSHKMARAYCRNRECQSARLFSASDAEARQKWCTIQDGWRQRAFARIAKKPIKVRDQAARVKKRRPRNRNRTPEELAEYWRNQERSYERKLWRRQQNGYASEMYSLDVGKGNVELEGSNPIDALLDRLEPEPRKPSVQIASDAEVDAGVFQEYPSVLETLNDVCEEAHRFGGGPTWFLVEHLGLSLEQARTVLIAADNAYRRVSTLPDEVLGRDVGTFVAFGGTNHGRGRGRKRLAPKGTRTGRKPRQKHSLVEMVS